MGEISILRSPYFLTSHRALGRSDFPHLSILIYPNVVLSAIVVFEVLRFLSRQGLRSPLTDTRAVAFAAMVWASCLIPQGTISPRDVVQWVHTLQARDDPELPRSTFLLDRVRPHDFLWEMEDGMMNYIHRRHNPTRHAVAYAISSPGEQRDIVAALRTHPPKLIVWRYPGINGIPNPLRYYVISPYLYHHYRPVAAGQEGPFLEPSPPGWPGQIDLEPPFNGPLPLRRLALRWGQDRIPELTGQILRRRALGPWQGQDRAGSPRAKAADTEASTWEIRAPIASRTWNYLKLDLACRSLDPAPSRQVEAVLEFAPTGRGYDEDARVSFTLIADGRARPYLIPIGCSPGWSWRPEIDRIRLSVPARCRLSTPRAECWQIDEEKD